MRVVSLRAPVPGAPPVGLHGDLTVVLGADPDDVADLCSTFAAIVGGVDPPLEALVDLEGATVALDAGFAAATGLVGAPSPVVVVPGPAGPPGTGSTAGHEEGHVAGPGRESCLDELTVRLRVALAGEGAVHKEAEHLADALEAVAGGRSHARARNQALRDLLAECRQALDAARAALAAEPVGRATVTAASGPDVVGTGAPGRPGGATPGVGRPAAGAPAVTGGAAVPADVPADAPADRVEEIQRMRREMTDVLGRPGPLNRRERARLRELRRTKAEALAALGHPNHASLAAALGLPVDDDPADPGRAREDEPAGPHRAGASADGDTGATSAIPQGRELTAARAVLLEELERHWLARLEEMAGLAREEAALLARAGELLGDPDSQVRSNPRVVAARLRGLTGPPADHAEVEDITRRLAVELGLDPSAHPSPEDVLAAATTEAGARWSLASELRRRAIAPAVPTAGRLPLLLVDLEEPSAAAGLDPRTVADLAAGRQVVWVTRRAEVADVAEQMGERARVIRT
jgi:hypothetical protein